MTDGGAQSQPVVGMVELFERHQVVGWVNVPAGAPATQPIRVGLYLNESEVASTRATEPSTPGATGARHQCSGRATERSAVAIFRGTRYLVNWDDFADPVQGAWQGDSVWWSGR